MGLITFAMKKTLEEYVFRNGLHTLLQGDDSLHKYSLEFKTKEHPLRKLIDILEKDLSDVKVGCHAS